MPLFILLILAQINTTIGYIGIGITSAGVVAGTVITIGNNINKKINTKADESTVRRELDQIHHKINFKANAAEMKKIGIQVQKIYDILLSNKK